jgi:hypothetical protein
MLRKWRVAGHVAIMPVIPATQETELRGPQFEASPGQKEWDPTWKINWGYSSSGRARPWIQSPVASSPAKENQNPQNGRKLSNTYPIMDLTRIHKIITQ